MSTFLPPLFDHLNVPIIAAPMFIVSSKEMVLAQCKAGIVGSFPALNAREEGEFEAWLQFLYEEIDRHNQANPEQPAAPFAVNQIVHKSNTRLEEDMALCVKYQVPLIITSLGAVEQINQAAHSYGGIVLHDVINNRHAHKAIEKGADGLIAVAAGAGGHAGRLSPFALIQEIREWFDGPLALSGSIATGDAVLAAQAMGADFAYIGSSFIASKEANAVPEYKQMVVDSAADDIVYTNYFSGVLGNYLKGSIINSGYDPDDLEHSDASKMNFADKEKMAKAWRDIWGCGQGIGVVDEVLPIEDKVAQLIQQYQKAKLRLNIDKRALS